MTKQHEWRVGDLCTRWVGIVCRVIEVKPPNLRKPAHSKLHYTRLKIVHAIPLFGKLKRVTVCQANECKPVSLVDLGAEYLKLGNFIRDEAEKNGMSE